MNGWLWALVAVVAWFAVSVPAALLLGYALRRTGRDPDRSWQDQIGDGGTGLFDAAGNYRLPPAGRTCTRCGGVVVGEDETGLYCQVPATWNAGPLFGGGGPDTVLTFMDRVYECGGQPHVLPGDTPPPGC